MKTHTGKKIRAVLIGGLIALFAIGAQGVASAAPPPGKAIGPQYTVKLTNAQQAAIIAGSGAALGVVACLTPVPGVCPASTIAIASASAYQATQAACPNAGIRSIVLQDYAIPHDEFDPKSPRTTTQVVSSTCGPK